MSCKLFLLGIGENTHVFIDLVEQCGYRIAGLYHYDNSLTGKFIGGYEVLGTFNHPEFYKKTKGACFTLTMGDNRIRHETAIKIRESGGITPRIIHPTAIISRFAQLQDGVSIGPFSFVQANSIIHEDTMILSGVNISHNVKIGKACLISGGATIGASTQMGDYVLVGQGALTISKKVKTIGDNSIIGARALVTKPVNANSVVAGTPARIIKMKQE